MPRQALWVVTQARLLRIADGLQKDLRFVLPIFAFTVKQSSAEVQDS